MSEMVERVKAAIAEKFAPAVDMRAPYVKVMIDLAARAAIEAMREPTDDMKTDGEVTPWNWGCHTCGGPKENWYRMIDAALGK